MPGPHHIAHSIRRELTPDPFSESPFQWGEVQAVHASPNTVDLYLDGNTATLTPGVRYLASYTPTVGDVVLVSRMGSDRVVHHKLA